MTRCLFFLAMFCVSYFFPTQVVAAVQHGVNPEDYIYNCEGTPLFVKVYVEKQVLQNRGSSSFLKLLQEDRNGSFLAVPIKKKQKDKNEDEENEDTWICPICNTKNPEYATFCRNTACPLYRNGLRDW